MTNPAPKPENKVLGFGVIAGIVLLIVLIGQCRSDTPSSNALEAMSTANADMTNAISAQAPPPPEPLNAVSISRGASHYRTAFTAEGFSGAMVYSQNCYDALGREFTWAKLDQCGAFDMLAVRALEGTDMPVPSAEQDYFQSEAVAGRYLAAATGAGQVADQADRRLSQLQTRASRERVPARRPPASTNDDTATNIGDTVNEALEEPRVEVTGE